MRISKDWIISRLKEASTYRGITLLAGAFGVYVDPTLVQAIGAGVLAMLGLIETVRKEG